MIQYMKNCFKSKNQDQNYNQKVQKILKKCYDQNQYFVNWAKQEKWATFHHSHYDWWAFPIDQNSSYGDQYKVAQFQISILKKDQKFLRALKINAQLVCLSWGYNLVKGQLIQKVVCKQQKWQNWPIRLYKMTRSLQIFQRGPHFKNAVKYGIILINKNFPMQYGKRNIKEYFIKCSNSMKISNQHAKY